MIESVEISELIPPTDPGVLHFNENRRAYEIRPGQYDVRVIKGAGFVREGQLYFTHSDRTARSLPEWELLADPDTYARLKTK